MLDLILAGLLAPQPMLRRIPDPERTWSRRKRGFRGGLGSPPTETL